MVERVFHQTNVQQMDWLHVFPRIAQYRANIEFTYAFLQQHSAAWLWNGYSLGDAVGPVLHSQHCFDAFLSALTAFAQAEEQTVEWDEVELDRAAVEMEGHILVLRQRPRL